MNKRSVLALVLAVLLLLGITGCGAKSNVAYDGAYSNGSAESYAPGKGQIVEDPAKGENGAVALPENRKLIQKFWLSVETEDMNILLSGIHQRIQELGGYVESQEVYNGSAYSGRRYRHAQIVIRIPAENLNQFVDHVGQVSNVVSSNQTVDDVTLSYVATESRIKALETEEARLLELLAKAENMNDLLTIEARLTDVRAELEQVKSTLRLYDNQVNYGTVTLNVSEVTEYTVVTEPETVWERIGQGLKESFQDIGEFFVELFVGLVISLPQLLLLAVLVIVVVVLVRRTIKKKKSKKNQET